MTAPRNSLEQALRLYDHGFTGLVPVPDGKKIPVMGKWQNLRISRDDLPKFFMNGENVGALNGEPSGHRVDVDTDVPEAIAVADRLMPPTRCVYGRPSKRRSHRYYVVPGFETKIYAVPAVLVPESRRQGKKRIKLIEVRGGGTQTILPGSRHPSGELYEWDEDGPPTEIDGPTLLARASLTAAATLFAIIWSQSHGAVHDIHLATAGWLLRSNWTVDDTVVFIWSAASAIGLDTYREEQRIREAVEDTKVSLDENRAVTGGRRLRELVGAEVMARLAEWLGVSDTGEPLAVAEPSALAAGEARGGAKAPEGATRIGNYVWCAAGLKRIITDKLGERVVPLTNFGALITGDVTVDDGVEVRRHYELEIAFRGRLLPRFIIPAEDFVSMRWIDDHIGAQAVVYPGQAEHTRVAIRILSDEVVAQFMYGHTGWRRIGNASVFLHAAGAIGEHGSVPGIQVLLPDDLIRYVLPDPPDQEETRAVVRATLGFLEVSPEEISIPVLGYGFRAPLAEGRFTLHLYGETGTLKTSVAAVAQAFFGAEMDSDHLPGNWSSTPNALEQLAFSAQHVLFVIDEYSPSTLPSAESVRMKATALRFGRAVGNRAARQRMRADTTIRPSKPPRACVLSTGEDVPGGQSVSLRARFLVSDVPQGVVNLGVLTRLQRQAADGVFASCMSAYVRWLAPQIVEIQKGFRAAHNELRAAAMVALPGRHLRTPGIAADLMLGIRYFLAFAEDVGAVTRSEADDLWARAWTAVYTVSAAQTEKQRDADPVERFLKLLMAVFASGRAHVQGSDGGRPDEAEQWGWQPDVEGRLTPRGHTIGFLDQDLFLDSESAFAAVQAIAATQGEPLTVSLTTLKARLHNRGYLSGTEAEGDWTRHGVRRQFAGGERRRYLQISPASLSSIESLGHLGQSPANLNIIAVPRRAQVVAQSAKSALGHEIANLGHKNMSMVESVDQSSAQSAESSLGHSLGQRKHPSNKDQRKNGPGGPVDQQIGEAPGGDKSSSIGIGNDTAQAGRTRKVVL